MWTDRKLGLVPPHSLCLGHGGHWKVWGWGLGPDIYVRDDILLMGCKGPDCGTHCPSGVTGSRMSALAVEFWRFPVGGEKQL